MRHLDATFAVFARTWIITWRRPVLLTFSLGQPLIWMLFFGFLFERVGLAAEVPYLDYLAPGVSLMTVLFGASQSGIGWIRDLATGFLPRMLGTPASPAAILAGKILADTSRLLLQAGAVLLLAILLGARLRFDPLALAKAIPAVVLFALAFCCLSSAVALQTRAQETMATFVHLINMPILFTSTALLPRQHMPEWLAAVARFNPLSLAVDAWRGALLGAEAPSGGATLAILGALAALLFLAALMGLRGGGRRSGSW